MSWRRISSIVRAHLYVEMRAKEGKGAGGKRRSRCQDHLGESHPIPLHLRCTWRVHIQGMGVQKEARGEGGGEEGRGEKNGRIMLKRGHTSLIAVFLITFWNPQRAMAKLCRI